MKNYQQMIFQLEKKLTNDSTAHVLVCVSIYTAVRGQKDLRDEKKRRKKNINNANQNHSGSE